MCTFKRETSAALACMIVCTIAFLWAGRVYAEQSATSSQDAKVAADDSQFFAYPMVVMNSDTMFSLSPAPTGPFLPDAPENIGDVAMVKQIPGVFTSATWLAMEEPGKFSPEATATKDAAQPDGGHSLEEINNKLNNPGTDLAQLNFKLTWNLYTGGLPGSSSQESLTLNFQPVLPFSLEDGGRLLVRPSIPLTWQPSFNAGKGGFDENFGLGDSQLVAFYSRTEAKKGYMWGLGATSQFPTHTDSALGKDQFQLGPAGFAGMMGKWGSAGVFPQHFWNIGGNNEGYTAFSVIQFWYWFNVGNGYQLGGSPIITYDWTISDSAEAWTVPVNVGLAKTIMVEKTPVKLKFEGIYYIDQPGTFGPDYGFQLTITPVIENPLAGLFGKKPAK